MEGSACAWCVRAPSSDVTLVRLGGLGAAGRLDGSERRGVDGVGHKLLGYPDSGRLRVRDAASMVSNASSNQGAAPCRRSWAGAERRGSNAWKEKATKRVRMRRPPASDPRPAGPRRAPVVMRESPGRPTGGPRTGLDAWSPAHPGHGPPLAPPQTPRRFPSQAAGPPPDPKRRAEESGRRLRSFRSCCRPSPAVRPRSSPVSNGASRPRPSPPCSGGPRAAFATALR